MEVTKGNFSVMEPIMKAAILAADFVAIDTEFTGLKGYNAPKETAVDAIQSRYDGIKKSAEDFMVMQYGICCFSWANDGQLVATPFNIYVFPRPFKRSNRLFLCESSSMDFLNGHGFDFGKWAREGIPFLSRRDEERAREQETKKSWNNNSATTAAAVAPADASSSTTTNDDDDDANEAPPIPDLKPDDAQFMQRTTALVRKMLFSHTQEPGLGAEGGQNGDGNDNSGGDDGDEGAPEFDSSNRPFMRTPTMNSYQRRLVYEHLESMLYPEGDRCFLQTEEADKASNHQRMRVTLCVSPTAKVQMAGEAEALKRAESDAEFNAAVGFRRVIDALSASGKPVIAHNGALDLFHTYDKFIGPLPRTHEEGTAKLHQMFPVLFDSKIALDMVKSTLRLDSTRLTDVLPSLDRIKRESPVVAADKGLMWQATFAQGYDRYRSTGSQAAVFEHEAAYDAYLTGVAFAAAASCMGLRSHMFKDLHRATTNAFHQLSHVVGKIPLFRLGETALLLPGPSPERDLSTFLAVSDFPVLARNEHLQRIFAKYLRPGERTMYMHWVDDRCFFLECHDMERYNAILADSSSRFTAAADDQIENLQLHNVKIEPAMSHREAIGGGHEGGGGGGGGGGGRKRRKEEDEGQVDGEVEGKEGKKRKTERGSQCCLM